jgi:hypothetical protein
VSHSSARYFALFAALWIVAMTWKLYPQFQDTLRVEGRIVTLDDYVEDACGERVGPLAASCQATTLEEATRLLASEQAKSLLLVEAPLILYVVLYLPLWLLRRLRP